MRKKRYFALATVFILLSGFLLGYFFGIHSMQKASDVAEEQRVQLEIEANNFCDQIGYAIESHNSVWLAEHYMANISEARFAVYEDMKLSYLGSVRGDTRAWDATSLSRDYTLLFAYSSPIPQDVQEILPAYEIMKIEETERLSIVVHIAKSENSSWGYVIQSFP